MDDQEFEDKNNLKRHYENRFDKIENQIDELFDAVSNIMKKTKSRNKFSSQKIELTNPIDML